MSEKSSTEIPKPLTPAETIELEYMRLLLSDTPTGGESDVSAMLAAATKCAKDGMAPMQAVAGLVENLAVRLNASRREAADLRVKCGQWEEKWKAAIDLLPDRSGGAS